MTKKTDNKMKILFGVIGLVFLLLVMTGFENPFKPLSIAYENQCSLPSCPSGYTLQNRYCQGEICYGVCEKPVEPYCGSYGGWHTKEGTATWKGNWDNDNWFTSQYTLSSNKCYTVKPQARVIPSNMGVSTALRIEVEGDGQTGSACSYGETKYLYFPEKVYDSPERRTITTRVKVTALDNMCNSYLASPVQFSNAEALITPSVYFKEANWIDDEVMTKEVSCSFGCSSDSDCGTSGYTGSKYCSGRNVVQKYLENTCLNYECASNENVKIIESCSNGCSNGACITQQEPELITIYRLENNQCSTLQINSQNKQSYDYNLLSECQAQIDNGNGETPVVPVTPEEDTKILYYVIGGVILISGLLVWFLISLKPKRRRR